MTLSVGKFHAVQTGRVALVTGGGKGLGAAIALQLAKDGNKVAVLGRDRLALERFARESNCLSLEADVTDGAAVNRAIARIHEEWGTISILVQNAGVATSAPLSATPDETWDRTLAVNVTAPFRLARALLPEMVAAGWGRVIHIGSTAALTGFPYTAAYCASKHALVGLTRALAAEFARTGVTINAICPGFLETEMTKRTIDTLVEKTGRSPADAKKAIEDQSPQKRLFQVEEVVHVVTMLCGDGARGINGQAIPICGGQVMR